MSIKKFALHLSKVLEFIIDPDQTCSVPGCRITSNLHILRDVLDYVDRTNETSIFISPTTQFPLSNPLWLSVPDIPPRQFCRYVYYDYAIVI